LWALGCLGLLIVAVGFATAPTGGAAAKTLAHAGAASPLKVGILSDCAGSFGAFYQDDIGGALSVFAHYGGKPTGKLPSDGMTGIKIAGRPVTIVGFGCADSTATKALSEARRLVEQDGANVLIGPLSGDEGIAIAEYSKTQPDRTFIDGISGAQATTLDVDSPNFFRFHADGAMWSAGLGDYGYSKEGWRNAVTIGDDYDFGYTSVSGFIAEFCSIGGQITKRIWAPLGTTDYSSYIAQIPKGSNVFVAIGGSGLVTFLKQYQQVNGKLNPKKVIGNTFWPDPTILRAVGSAVVGVVAANGVDADSNQPAMLAYKKVEDVYPAVEKDFSSIFVEGYWTGAQALVQALTQLHGDLNDPTQSKLNASLGTQTLNGPFGPIKLDKYRSAITPNWIVKITPPPAGSTTPGIKTIEEIPNVSEGFGGFFTHTTPAPSRTQPQCVKKTPPSWVGHEIPINFPASK
jgi:branched-chain amino acid transport system substrate-binding protein